MHRANNTTLDEESVGRPVNPEIPKQVEKILRSECFQGKAQMQSLLRLLALHWDAQAALKPDRIIAELWGADANRKSSADVAGAIARLRKTLDRYYADEGVGDPVVLRLPDRSARATATEKYAQWIVAEPRAAVAPAPLPTLPLPPDDAAEANTPSTAQPLPSTRPAVWIWFASAAASAAILVLATFFLLLQNAEPNAVQLTGSTMQVVDSDGKALWAKSFPEGFWSDFYRDGVATRVWFQDLGDGHKSLLLLYHPANDPQAHSSTLICYSHRGKELWRFNPGRPLPELPNDPPVFIARTLAILKSANHPTQIAVLSDHFPRYPAQIALLDVHGKTLSEYWHSGHLDHMVAADLDGNGHQQLIASGIANGYKSADLVVLDQDRIAGASVETGETRFQLHNLGVAQERLHLLFTRSDLNTATTTYNFSKGITIANGSIRVSVQECELNPYCLIWYEFDPQFRLRSLYLDDHFKDAHAAYFKNAIPPHSLKDEIHQFEKLRCLVGCPTPYVPSLINQPGSPTP